MSFFTDPIGSIKATITNLESDFAKLPSWLQSFAEKIASEEGVILSGLVSIANADLKALLAAGQLTTAAVVTEAKKIFASLIAQNISTFTMQDVFAAVNGAISSPTTSV